VHVIESLNASDPRAPGAVRDAEKAGATDHEPPGTGGSFARHVAERTIVLPDLQILFLPVPKAGCTTVLWVLAELAGLPLESFARSVGPEVSPAMTVHDMSLWADEHRLEHYDGPERERVLTEDGWLRFAVVRHPGTRLWSAWQSKLLLREPRFAAAFGEEPWFPRVPERPSDLVEDFRRFVEALPGGASDVHWAVQQSLVAELPLTHMGRVERLGETLALLRTHVGSDFGTAAGGRENRTALPLPPTAYDETAARVANAHFAADLERFAYEPVGSSDDQAEAADWERRVEPLLPLLRDVIDKHGRIGHLHRLARRVQTLEETIDELAEHADGEAPCSVLTNLEGNTEFNVRWAWGEGPLEPGFTAVVRVKNEATALPWVLPPLLRAVRRVVLVDNESTDDSAAIARRVAAELGATDRLEIVGYPFSVARCGQEHLETAADSVHSLTYFYNWSFSHVRTQYALKWDGDMILSDALVSILRDLAWQLEAHEALIKMPRHPLYVADERVAFIDTGLANTEPWAWPNRPGYRFTKAIEWELSVFPPDVGVLVLPAWSCVELKHLDADEFGHWSQSEFDATARTRRKRREWDVFQALARGADPPEDVVRVEAPRGQHVIDYVRSTWLPRRASTDPGGAAGPLSRLTGRGWTVDG
jgi:hypothetical protein